jgi:hypothetical protein
MHSAVGRDVRERSRPREARSLGDAESPDGLPVEDIPVGLGGSDRAPELVGARQKRQRSQTTRDLEGAFDDIGGSPIDQH